MPPAPRLRLLALLLLPACLLPGVAADPPPVDPDPPTLFPSPVVPLRDRDQILDLLARVADFQLAWPDERRSTHWTRATGFLGLLALSRASGDPRHQQVVERIAEETGWKPGPPRYHADDHIIGQCYLELHALQADEARLRPLRETFDAILAEPRTGSLEFSGPQRSDRWSWCDALFMAPPAWAGLSTATGDPRYLEFMLSEWKASDAFLYDTEDRLYHRDSRFFHERLPDGRKLFWSRGNGWVLAAFARVLPLIPENRPERAAMATRFREFSDRVVSLQPASGLWTSSMYVNERFNEDETSGSALFCYGLAWGVNAGLLSRDLHGEAALRAWDALAAHVQPDGRLIHVQPVGHRPFRFKLDTFEVYGSGALLLAGEQILLMLETRENPETCQ